MKRRPAPPLDPNPIGTLQSVPVVASRVALVELGVDYQGIMDCLRDKKSPKDVLRRRVVVTERETPADIAK